MPRISTSADIEDEDQRSSLSGYSEAAMEVAAEEAPVKVKKSAGRPKKGKAVTPPPKEEGEDEDMDEEAQDEDDEADGEEDEDVFVVEGIINHRITKKGDIEYHVRWKDWPKLEDHTWQTEDDLANCLEILEEYIEGVGGRDALGQAPTKPAGKKRGRKSATNGTATPSVTGSQQPNGNKRARKLESEDPKAEESPAPSKPKLPPGNWEDEIATIDTMERQVGGLYILLTFKNGTRLRQPAPVVYRRCPQKMLQFYESHLTFRPTQTATESPYYEDYK